MRIVVVLVAAILFAGCSSAADVQRAASAAAGFHALLDSGQFDSIYDASSDDLKKTATRQDFDELLAAVHRKLGPTQSASQLGWNVNYNTSGTFVRLTYGTKYSEGDAQELFVYRVQGDKVSLAGYDIASRTLVTK